MALGRQELSQTQQACLSLLSGRCRADRLGCIDPGGLGRRASDSLEIVLQLDVDLLKLRGPQRGFNAAVEVIRPSGHGLNHLLDEPVAARVGLRDPQLDFSSLLAFLRWTWFGVDHEVVRVHLGASLLDGVHEGRRKRLQLGPSEPGIPSGINRLGQDLVRQSGEGVACHSVGKRVGQLGTEAGFPSRYWVVVVVGRIWGLEDRDQDVPQSGLLSRLSQQVNRLPECDLALLSEGYRSHFEDLGQPASKEDVAHRAGQRRAMLGFPLKARAAGGAENGGVLLQQSCAWGRWEIHVEAQCVCLDFESDAAGLAALGKVPQGCVVDCLVACRHAQIDAGGHGVPSHRSCRLAGVGVNRDALHQSGDADSVRRSLEDIAHAAPKQLGPPDQSRVGGVTQLRPPWGRDKSDCRGAKGSAGAHPSAFGTMKVELGIEVVPECDVDLTRHRHGREIGRELSV